MVEIIIKEMMARVPKRTQEILWRRFGLKTNKPETLESIGQGFGITRERVRQIEEGGLRTIKKVMPEGYREFTSLAEAHLRGFGGAREGDRFLDELTFVTSDRHPAARSRARFLLSLSDAFSYVPETERYRPFWAKDQTTKRKVVKFLGAVSQGLRKRLQPISVDELEDFAWRVAQAQGLRNLERGILISYFTIAKELAVNPFGHFGHVDLPTIVPRGVRDRAYVVLQNAQKPMHFQELAKLINTHVKSVHAFHPAWKKSVEAQTVHNELIKDNNFVLVGRGIYALKEWGYEPGTVRELLARTLRTSRKPLTKYELLEAIKQKRFVKENTILINLQNRRFFERLPDGRYRVRGGHRHIPEEA